MKTCRSLKEFCQFHERAIFDEMAVRLARVEWTSYQEFILRTSKGRRALRFWITLLFGSLGGRHGDLYRYIAPLASSRTAQGFDLDFSYHIHRCLRQVVEDLLDRSSAGVLPDSAIRPGLEELTDVLLTDYNVIATSFIEARERAISEKVTHLQHIFEYTQGLITVFDRDAIVRLTLKTVAQFFGVEHCAMLLSRGGGRRQVAFHPASFRAPAVLRAMERGLASGEPICVDVRGWRCAVTRRALKRAVYVPVHPDRRPAGVIALHDARPFEFQEKELGLLYQFLLIMAVALDNALMVEEIERSHGELRLVTRKMLAIQEEERKRLAADLHDTLAQSLSGINYKLQFCQELVKSDPSASMAHFEDILRIVHRTVEQTKELITSLRPDLIDTMGLLAALRRHVSFFIRETGIRVGVRLPNYIRVPPEVNICLFRVAQEALTNVYKHAGVASADLSIEANRRQVRMVVEDLGRGFDAHERGPRRNGSTQLGLVSMKERVTAVGGTLAIHASRGSGCRVEACIPLT